MSTLKQFSEKERDYHAYRARQNFLRQQRTIEWEREQDRLEKPEALREKDKAVREKDEAMREVERLKALLLDK